MAKIYYNDNGTWKVVDIPGGGSGGSGDVTAAGNNTFTGKNAFEVVRNSPYSNDRLDIFSAAYNKESGAKAIVFTPSDYLNPSSYFTIGLDGIAFNENYETRLKPGSLRLRPAIADAGVELGVFDEPPTPMLKTYKYDGTTGAITIPYGQTGTMVVDSNVKTQFGNQSIVGSGNIDLYRHVIKFSGSTSKISTECYCIVYSSKNLNVDSLTDLKTLLGNTFVEVCTGNVRYKTQQDSAAQAVLVKESGIYYCLGGSSYYILETAGWTGITISDTVTTV